METLSQEDFALRVFFNRQLCRLLGLCLFGFIFFCFASLCDWNILDPSFSHATNRPVTNIMGYWGAVFSDLAIQLYGLSSVVFLIPLIFWAKNLVFGYSIRHPIRRFFYWFFSSFLLAGLAALIPVPFHWPLPTGLGGVFGDTLIKPLTILIDNFNISKNFYLLISTLFLFLPGIFLFIASLDLRDFSPSISNNKVDENEEFDDLIEDERKSFSFIGYLMHAWLFLRAFLRRYVRKLLGLEKNKAHAFMKEPKAFYSSSFSEDKVEPQFFETPANQDFRSSKDFFLQEKFEGGDSLISQNDIEMPLPSMDTLMKDFCSDPSFSKGQPKSSAMVYSKRSENKKFEFPPLTFLAEARASLRDPSVSKEALQKNARILEGILEDFGVKGEIIHVKAGPVVTLYELEPAPGIKSSRVIGLADDIARSMSAVACRVAVVSGRNAIGIELPNLKRETVYLREILSSPDFRNAKSGLPLALGKTINGDSVVGDITRMPHVLVAGTTGSGKSVAINTMILSLVYKFTPQECRLIMIDPKMLELSVYEGIPHLLTPVVTDPQKALAALKWTVREMEDRYCKMSKVGVRNIDGFNIRVAQAEKNGERIDRTVQTGFDKETGKAIYETETLQLKKMPYIVVIIDEMADLMMVAGKDIEGAVQRLAQMARAAGIHVIMATQRPSVDVITGTIKANFPTRISFQVTSKIDSRTILGEQGAEQLLGMGDMLYMAGGGRIQRVHGPFVSDSEVEKVVQHLKLQGTPEYLDDVTLEDGDDKEKDEEYGYSQDPEDPYTLALDVVSRDGKVSTSYIQRRLGIGYNRAASIIERMEKEGIIGKPNHAGKREILIPIEKDRM